METLQHTLEELLQAHGLPTATYKEWVLVEGKLPGMAASLANRHRLENGYSLQLDIEVAFSQEQVIRESFAGAGTSEQEAVGNALEAFCQNSLHVLLAALWGKVDEHQVTIERWDVDAIPWQVFIGNYGLRTFGNFQVGVPENAFSTLEQLIRALPLPGNLHWVRTFYCHTGAGKTVSEVLRDNEPWEAAQEAIDRLEWPRIDPYYSVRQFLILRRPELPGG